MEKRKHEEFIKNMCLIQELDLAVNTVKSGLALVQMIKPYNTTRFLIFLLLTTSSRIVRCNRS